jgi:hypothetical protein
MVVCCIHPVIVPVVAPGVDVAGDSPAKYYQYYMGFRLE